MIMKRNYCTLLLLFWLVGLWAQGPTKSRRSSQNNTQRWHELELNSVFLLQEIFGASNTADIQNAYLVGYKTGKGNVGWRFGLGAGLSLKSEQESLLDQRITTRYDLRSRVGIEWRKDLMERWQLISGVDAVIESSFREDETKTNFDNITTKDSSIGVGGGPILGLRFWINPKISLATETGLQALYLRKIEEVNSQNIPDFNTKRVTIENPVRFSPPVNLYLIIRL